IGAIAGSALAATNLPGPVAGGVLASAVAGACCAHPVFRRVDRLRERVTGARLLAVALVVVMPLFLFGLGMTIWTVREGLPWDITVAALMLLGSISSAYLRRQPGGIFAGQLAMWSAAVLVLQSLAGALALGVAFGLAIAVSRELLRDQRLEDEQRQALDRVQTRARDILRDYEETRQGWFWETDRRSQLTYVSA